MAWKATAQLQRRAYKDKESKYAFIAGYADGYNGHDQYSGWHSKNAPNAYSAGYHEGVWDSGIVSNLPYGSAGHKPDTALFRRLAERYGIGRYRVCALQSNVVLGHGFGSL